MDKCNNIDSLANNNEAIENKEINKDTINSKINEVSNLGEEINKDNKYLEDSEKEELNNTKTKIDIVKNLVEKRES